MCTLSWQIREDSLTVIFNRDELLSRPDALPPETQIENGVHVLAPRDPEGGGTWISANEYGLVFCLMNYYGNTARENSRGSFQSRGLLVKKMSGHTDLHIIRKSLADIDIRQYRPFHFIVFPGAFTPIEWQWDGNEFREVVASLPLLTTSGSFPSLTRWARTRVFRKAADNYNRILTDEQHLAIHRNRRPWPASMSIAMKRRGRETVSLTRVQVHPDKVLMDYLPGNPATTQQPMQSCQLKRTANPAPERKIIPCVPYPDNPVKVATLLREKNPKMYRNMSGITKKLVRFVAKEGIINQRLNHLKSTPCNFFASKVLNIIGVKGFLKPASGALPDPESRPVFMANHPAGGLEGLLMLHWLSIYYPGVRLIVNDLLWNLPHMRPYIVPVDVFGDSRKALKKVFEVFEGDAPLFMFPSGQTARKEKGTLTEARWQKNAVKMAILNKRTVVPIRISGYNSRFFYSIAWLRKLLRIPLNLEMMMLSREFFNPACKEYGIITGGSISHDHILAMGKTNEERAEKLRQICMGLTAD